MQAACDIYPHNESQYPSIQASRNAEIGSDKGVPGSITTSGPKASPHPGDAQGRQSAMKRHRKDEAKFGVFDTHMNDYASPRKSRKLSNPEETQAIRNRGGVCGGCRRSRKKVDAFPNYGFRVEESLHMFFSVHYREIIGLSKMIILLIIDVPLVLHRSSSTLLFFGFISPSSCRRSCPNLTAQR